MNKYLKLTLLLMRYAIPWIMLSHLSFKHLILSSLQQLWAVDETAPLDLLNDLQAQKSLRGADSKYRDPAALGPLVDGSCLPLIKSVKLQQTRADYINLFELEVLDRSGANVALGKTASQSSTVHSAGAMYAIDGDMTTISNTDKRGYKGLPWLNIDLGASYDVEKIVIHNRWCVDPADSQHKCLCRLSGANLLLYDDSGAVVKSVSVGNTCGTATLEFDLCPTENPTKVRQHLLDAYEVDYF
jgi:hypothetical protein